MDWLILVVCNRHGKFLRNLTMIIMATPLIDKSSSDYVNNHARQSVASSRSTSSQCKTLFSAAAPMDKASRTCLWTFALTMETPFAARLVRQRRSSGTSRWKCSWKKPMRLSLSYEVQTFVSLPYSSSVCVTLRQKFVSSKQPIW